MLLAGKTRSGLPLWPRWWCFFFGGTFRQKIAGYGWTPGVFRLTKRYFREGWNEHQSWWSFVRLKA
jgi:hypothetical protein